MYHKLLLIVVLTLSACKLENNQTNFVILSDASDVVIGKSLHKEVNRNNVLSMYKIPTSSNSGQCTLNSTQQSLLDEHNLARSIGRNCGTTFYPATTPLQWDCTLAGIALEHNMDMAENNFFSHTGSDGLSSSQRATNAGYNWQTVGENIAAGQTSVAQVMEGWLESPGHCSNIMRPQYQELGADFYQEVGSQHYNYWTANFGTEF